MIDGDIPMLTQVNVDDIIFGSTKSSMVKDFEELMQKEFKMSSMGELTFFLGLQVKQSNGGIFLSQDKYVKDILNKFDFRTIKPASTPIEAHKSLRKMKRFQVLRKFLITICQKDLSTGLVDWILDSTLATLREEIEDFIIQRFDDLKR
ncbi:putative ribonuclease H-like domain-containing protein [Tanacetum coccineum]